MPAATIKTCNALHYEHDIACVLCNAYLCVPDAITCNKSTWTEKLEIKNEDAEVIFYYNPSIMLQYKWFVTQCF